VLASTSALASPRGGRAARTWHQAHANCPKLPPPRTRTRSRSCAREFWRGKRQSEGGPRSPLAGGVTPFNSSEGGAAGAGRVRPLPIVNFKDLNLSVDDELDSEDMVEGGGLLDDATNKHSIIFSNRWGGGAGVTPASRPMWKPSHREGPVKQGLRAGRGGACQSVDPCCSRRLLRGAQKSRLVIIMVGLPGRGKTFLCNKLKCYLNW